MWDFKGCLSALLPTYLRSNKTTAFLSIKILIGILPPVLSCLISSSLHVCYTAIFPYPLLNKGITDLLIQEEGKDNCLLEYLASSMPIQYFWKTGSGWVCFWSSMDHVMNGELLQCCTQKNPFLFFWQKHSPIYFPSRGTLQSPQTISRLITAQEFVMSDFSYLLASSSALFNVSFNKTYWHGILCCTTGSCPRYSQKQVSRLNKVKIRTVLKGISKAHVYMLNESSYNDFLSIKDSFQLCVVMIFFKIIIITSQKTLAAVGILTLPNYTANKGSRENVRVKWRPMANPNTLDPPLSKWAGQKPSGSCQRGMRLWNELPTDC